MAAFGTVQAQKNQPPLVYAVENTGSSFKLPNMPGWNQLPEIRELPDPLVGVKKFKDWSKRRSDIGHMIQHYGIGTKPTVKPGQVKARMKGDTIVVDVDVNGETLTLTSEIRYPKTGQPPYAVMIGTSMMALPRQLFEDRPIAIMNFHEKQVNDYGQMGRHHERGEHPFDRLYPDLTANGAYSEWAWGLSRLIDGLQQLGPEVTKIDTKHIGVTGCSYAGKMALYCGAFDERIALTIAQEPGGGGAAAWRASHESKVRVEDIDKTDYHWFLESQKVNFSGDSVYRLPYDQHELCAMVCPRALLLLGNPDYEWLSDPAMLVSAKAAKKVWERFGIGDRMGWSIVSGHGHCQLPERQFPEVQAFIDRFLLGRDVNTSDVKVVSGLPGADGSPISDFGKPVTWDRLSLMVDGKRVCPVMGEIHYSRLPEAEWRQEVRKMKAGGVTLIATYVFWNHVEEQEGIFRWDGQRSLRRFIEICKDERMPVVLRLGPFCHGEVRNGGIPDWVFAKGCRVRSQDPQFMRYAEQLYRQIFTQVQGLQWKDGGPVIAAQFDNEYRGRGDYLMGLKRVALAAGFDLPFYTRTGWPELSTPVRFGEMLPLYGDYADGFWDRTLGETDGNYYKAFNFKAFRSSTAIATEQFGDQMAADAKGDENYPYLTCELGGGMATAYHRRPFVYPEDAYSMALVKLGSGSNLLGYYMYHGGTNPEGLTTLNENQRTTATNYNDMPVLTYDFQAPLGEFGQTYPQYYMLRPLHLFMQDWGEQLAPMEPSFPAPQDLKKGDDTQLRWAYRSQGNSGFIFINNYERLQNLSAKKNVQLSVCGVVLPRLTIPAGTMAVFPVNIDGIRYATAQLVARREGKTYLMQIPGIPTTISMMNGKQLTNVKPLGTQEPVYGNLYLITREQAEHLFLESTGNQPSPAAAVSFTKVREAGQLRQITIGAQKVAEEPQDMDFAQAAVYKIQMPSLTSTKPSLLSITYRGDVARLYADGKLIADNFYYGRPFLYGLWRLPEGTKELELRILPLQKDMPVYLPREADATPGEQVYKVEIK